MRPRLAAPHRNARLGIATLLGVLLGVVLLAVVRYSGGVPSTVPGWQVGAPIVGVFVLPAALSLGLDRRQRRSLPTLLGTLGVMTLVDAVLVVLMLIITASGAPANIAILVAYLLGGPFIAAAAPAFTVGGLGGYAAPWAGIAVWSGILAWVGTGVAILPIECYAYFFLTPPCDSTKHLCIDLGPAIILFLLFLFAVGLVVAPLGGLAGGGLRAWVGRDIRAV
jgi:hypothetical protein